MTGEHQHNCSMLLLCLRLCLLVPVYTSVMLDASWQ